MQIEDIANIYSGDWAEKACQQRQKWAVECLTFTFQSDECTDTYIILYSWHKGLFLQFRHLMYSCLSIEMNSICAYS